MPVTPQRAETLAARLLGDRRTKLGGLFVDHARRVASGIVDTDDAAVIAAALLHDVVEKGAVSADELLAMTGDERVVEIVELLTQRDGESDYVYLSRCARRPETLQIKRLDLADKLDAPDTVVPADVAERLRRRARQRLALLERFALGND
jgi:(p)ppGpp synthase/HD superfamily hydrolase